MLSTAPKKSNKIYVVGWKTQTLQCLLSSCFVRLPFKSLVEQHPHPTATASARPAEWARCWVSAEPATSWPCAGCAKQLLTAGPECYAVCPRVPHHSHAASQCPTSSFHMSFPTTPHFSVSCAACRPPALALAKSRSIKGLNSSILPQKRAANNSCNKWQGFLLPGVFPLYNST